MNAIIVGKNGVASMKQLVKLINDIEIFLFIKRETSRGIEWKRISSLDPDRPVSCDQPSFDNNDTVIKWGNSIPLSISNNDLYYNKGMAINNASNKLESRLIFEESNIACPRTYVSVDSILQYPTVIRPVKHRAGKSFYIANSFSEAKHIVSTKKDLSKGYYASDIYPKTREFRVHCALGKILVIKEKPAPKDKSIVAWNFAINEEEWTTIPRKDYVKDICLLSLQAMDSIGLDIGAVDIMSYPSIEGFTPHVVCEINTAPSLTPYLAEKYASLFSKIFKTTSRIEKWEYQSYKEGMSFCWKNFQMT
jgi:hypothetical protein